MTSAVKFSGDIETNYSSSSSTKASTAIRRSFPGKATEAEEIAEQIERRRSNRIEIPFVVRQRILHDCHRIASNKGYDKVRISLTDLLAYRETIIKETKGMDTNPINRLWMTLGFFIPKLKLLEVLNRAVDVVQRHRDSDSDDNDCWFHYQDFTFYHTRDVSEWPFWRTEMRAASVIIFAYYFFTPILFCHIVDENEICVTHEGNSYDGWMSSLYFASTTLSTVGYGDLSVQQDPRWRSFIGTMYMILSMIVAVVAFSAAADSAFSPLEDEIMKKLVNYFAPMNDDDFLYKRVRRIKVVRLCSITVEFFLLNLLGVFVSRAFTTNSNVEEQDWTFMTSLYWAVQTTTTIGYGDLDMPFNMRWFQIFYLTISTYFIGSCLGQLGSLKSEIHELRRHHAWNRQRVTKRFINEMQAYTHDDKVDQFEFLVASLVQLEKISSDDIKQVMSKYQELAGKKGYISISDDASDVCINDDTANPENAENIAGFAF